MATLVSSNIDEFANKQLTEILEKSLEQACLIVEGEAKSRCPVDDGQLRQSITHKVEGTTGEIGTNVAYAPYVEIGTGIYSSEGNGRTTAWTYQKADGTWATTDGQRPQPFLKPAAEENVERITKCFKEVF